MPHADLPHAAARTPAQPEPRYRRTDPGSAAPRTRIPGKQPKKNPFSEHGGTLVLVFLVCLFGAYMLDTGGVKTAIDGIFAGMHRRAHTHDAAVASGFVMATPYIILGLGLALTWILFGGFGSGKRRKRPAAELSGELTLHEFAESARAYNVCAKVARAAYRQVCPDYTDRMRGLLEAELHSGMGLDDAAVQALFAALLARSDRPAGRPFVRNAHGKETLLDLLRAVEARPDQARERALRPAAQGGVEARVLVPLPPSAAPAPRRAAQAVPPALTPTPAAARSWVAAAAAAPLPKPAAAFVPPVRLPPGVWSGAAATGVPRGQAETAMASGARLAATQLSGVRARLNRV